MYQFETIQILKKFEDEMSRDQRLPKQSILEIFRAGAELYLTSTTLTMLMTRNKDEQPCRVSYFALLRRIHRAANLFSTLGGSAPGVA